MLKYRLTESRGLTLSLHGRGIGGEETETLGCFLGPFQKGALGAPSPLPRAGCPSQTGNAKLVKTVYHSKLTNIQN